MSKLTDFLKKYWLILLVVLLAVMLPTIGHAQSIADTPNATIRPRGSDNAWTLYVFGSARVIQELFMSIKMLVAPDIGSSGFITLMYLVAIVGFFVLAVAAGFDPGKNFMRMFTYILVVWGVVFSTTKLKADLHIIDKVGNTAPEVVTGAPALIVIPASLVSQVGEYFSRSVETYFSIPGSFKMSNVGQFNLFATMLADSTQFKIKDEGISKTMSSYAGDCIVPAIARGQFKGPVKTVQSYGDALINPGVPVTTETMAYGYEALMKTTDLMKTYESANSPAILTKYYPANGGKNADGSASNWRSTLGLPDSVIGTPTNSADFGVVVPCEASYKALKNDIDMHANSLLTASGKAWGAAGGNQLYSTLFTDMLSSASSTEGPSSYIRQKALLYEMNNSFKGAAMMAGNSEILQTLSIAQAEQQQKSMMVSAFSVFNNMMGYMYTVLQAFLFGMAPIIILAMLVPGLGKSILVNYMQVLIWLALWTPLLGIVNYIITLFGQYDVSQVFLSAGGGLNKSNDALVSEKANNLIIAGQFLGTLVPMISWGIIKGAMAFTEFINHGIGSQFAAQAGATAATGNYSLNNASADNLSMNKFSTQMSSAVGAGPVQAGLGAGATDLISKTGGSGYEQAGQRANPTRQLSEQLQSMKQQADSAVDKLTAAASKGHTIQSMMDMHKGSGTSIKNDAGVMSVGSQILSIGQQVGMNEKIFDIGNGKKMSANEVLTEMNKLGAGFKVSGGFDVPLVPLKAGGEISGGREHGRQSGTATEGSVTVATGASGTTGTTDGTQIGRNTNVTEGQTEGADKSSGLKHSKSQTYNSQSLIQSSLDTQRSYTASLSRSMNDVQSLSLAESADQDSIKSMIAKWNSTPQLSEAQFNKDMAALTGTVQNKGNAAGLGPGAIDKIDPKANDAEEKRIAGIAAAGGAEAAKAAKKVKAPDVVGTNAKLDKKEAELRELHAKNEEAGRTKANNATGTIDKAGKVIEGTALPMETLTGSSGKAIRGAVNGDNRGLNKEAEQQQRVEKAKETRDAVLSRGLKRPGEG